MKNISVILPAAGKGLRFGSSTSKIFASLAGEAVFLRTLKIFASRSDICQIQLVVSPETLEYITANYSDESVLGGVELTLGGATRTESVSNALERLATRAEFVCIHDAVRPCVSNDAIDAVIKCAQTCGAALLASPICSTIKRIGSDSIITETVSRDNLFAAQTPQVFKRDILLNAYNQGVSGTDDASLVEAIGVDVKVVNSSAENIKITTKADLALAEAILRSRNC